MKSILDNDNVKIILASKSPRRQEILKNLGIKFEVLVSNFDEKNITSNDFPNIIQYVKELALNKGLYVLEKINKELKYEYFIISADTIVVLEDKILGQPSDETNAKEMLKMLSGKKNQVITGLTLIYMHNDKKEILTTFEITDVYFKQLTDYEIDRYIKTKEPLDKAGAYGIQGKASLFIEKIDGCYFNVVGLPVMKLSKLFEQFNYSLI